MKTTTKLGLAGDEDNARRMFFFLWVPITLVVMIGAAVAFTTPRPLDKVLARHQKAK